MKLHEIVQTEILVEISKKKITINKSIFNAFTAAHPSPTY